MAGEREVAAKTLLAVAIPIRNQSIEFGDKLAVGTGAALVLLVSQLGELKDHIPPTIVFTSTLLGVASLMSYMVARYCAIQATVIADAQDDIRKIVSGRPPDLEFDVKIYRQETLSISVWPARWFIALGSMRKTVESVSIYVIRKSQEVTRYLMLQIVAMFASLLLLVSGFAFYGLAKDELPPQTCVTEKQEPVVNYSRIDCGRR